MENYPIIPFVPDRKTVMRRLGSAKADFSLELESELNGYLKTAQSLFSAKGRAGIFEIEHIKKDAVSLQGFFLESKLLSKLLLNSAKIYLMCATLAKEDVAKISEAMSGGEGLKAIVFDAYASECVDGALGVMMERKNAALLRTGQKLTKKRFSAGYGDLDISYQKKFYDLLDMQTLGVSINDKYLLSPEKSVIAIAGVQ